MVTVEVDPVRVESRLAAGGIACPTCGDGVLGRLGVCASAADRRGWRSDAAAAGAVPGVRGDARVVAGDGVAAQGVCGGTDLGCVDGPRRRVGASPDRAASLGVPAATVRGWLRRASRAAGGGAVVVSAGGGRSPGWTWGCRTRSGCAVAGRAGGGGGRERRRSAPVRCGRGARRGDAGRVAVAASGGRLLAPGWPS